MKQLEKEEKEAQEKADAYAGAFDASKNSTETDSNEKADAEQ